MKKDQIKMTEKRMRALQYANGDGEDRRPSYGVTHALERLGLIFWVGSFGVGFARVQNENCKRPWRITAKGKSILDAETIRANRKWDQEFCRAL
jgi:hypothetical protein